MSDIAAVDDLHYRRLDRDDLAAAHRLSQQVQWPHRLEDWALVLGVGDGVVALIDGQVVGTAMYWRYGVDFATLGMVIVTPERQGRGIGRRLMSDVIEALGTRSIQLNATQAGQPLYESMGFAAVGGVRQHQGVALNVPIGPLAPGERIRPVGPGDEATVAALDGKATGLSRLRVLSALGEAAQGVLLERDGETVGFALCRRFGRGYSIGPVVAPDEAGAKALIGHWVGSHAGMFMRIDVPDGGGLSNWLEEFGLARASGVVTMVRGRPPRPGVGTKLFALVNQALG